MTAWTGFREYGDDARRNEKPRTDLTWPTIFRALALSMIFWVPVGAGISFWLWRR